MIMKFVYGIAATLVAVFAIFAFYNVKHYLKSELEIGNFVLAKVSKYFITELYPQNTTDNIIATRKYLNDLEKSNSKGNLATMKVSMTLHSICREDKKQSNITIRIYYPDTSKVASSSDGRKLYNLPVIFWLHGGGFVLATTKHLDAITLSKLTNFLIVGVDYRLAPEDPYPAALEDCATALKWIKSNIHLHSGDPNKIIIGGTSAGGNLAVVLTALTKDNKKFTLAKKQPRIFQLTHIQLKGLFVLSPMLQFDMIRPSWLTYKDTNGLLTLDQVLWFWSLYLGPSVFSPAASYGTSGGSLNSNSGGGHVGGGNICSKDYKVCPLNAPKRILEKFPPTAIILPKHDVLLDEGLALNDLLKSYGVKVETRVFNDSTHSFWPGFDYTKSYVEANFFLLHQLMSMADYESVNRILSIEYHESSNATIEEKQELMMKRLT